MSKCKQGTAETNHVNCAGIFICGRPENYIMTNVGQSGREQAMYPAPVKEDEVDRP